MSTVATTQVRSYQWDEAAVSAQPPADLDGLALLTEMLEGRLPRPPIGDTLDFTLTSLERGRAVFELTPAGFHYNPIGTVHGGVLATLLDSATGCALHTMLPAGTGYTSLDLAVKFLRPVTVQTGRLYCEGTVSHVGGRTALAEARIRDGADKLIASATSTLMIFRPQT